MKSGAATIAEYSYDAVGNRTQQTNGNGTSTEYTFDSDPRYKVASITHKRGANVLAQIGYPSRDKVGNPLAMSDWTGTWGYDYDDNNRLIGATPPAPVPGQPAGGPYGYDWVGNRLNPPIGANHMVYNDADQLVKWPGMHGDSTHVGYVYDGAGNLTAVKDVSGIYNTASYTYTPTGLLDTASFKEKDGNTRTLANSWDADSNRVGFDANGAEYDLVYDTTAGIPAVIEESSGGSTAHYIREPGGSLIARLHPTDGIRCYHFDELGSTRLLTDANGAVTDRYTYDAYGSLLSHDRYSGSVSQPYQYVGQLGYYTQYQEPEFGLLQLGVRFYDPKVGRFTSRDAFPADRETSYAYVRNQPTVLTDPKGLLPTFFPGSSCDASARSAARWANRMIGEVAKQFPEAGIDTCNVQINVRCITKLGGCWPFPRWCGIWRGGHNIIVSDHPSCPWTGCLMLHEAIHVCTGIAKPKSWPWINIPGCGYINYGHRP